MVNTIRVSYEIDGFKASGYAKYDDVRDIWVCQLSGRGEKDLRESPAPLVELEDMLQLEIDAQRILSRA